MQVLYLILAIIFAIAGLAAWIFLIYEAFQDEIWKGIVGLLCSLYLLFWALFEFDHEHKWVIFLLWLGGSAIASGFLRLGGYL